MREIKFRAWDRTENRMWWNVQNAYDTLGAHATPDPNVFNGDDFSPRAFGEALEGEQYVCMQFTGLHDKNGKEIYEGDILSHPGSADLEEHGVVFYEDGAFQVQMPGMAYELADCVYYSYMRVIGNEYENPELLKEAV